jgi:regulator of sigma E protease
MLTSTLSFLFVLGVLVFVHELGHFLAARRLGIRVLTFSLGFGPKLLKVQRGDTEYCISAVPLGGYVKMAGENLEDGASGAPDEFLSKTKWERFQVLIMGPVMNLALAVVVLAGVLYNGAEVPMYESQPPVIGSIEADSPAEKVGLRPGDVILDVAGRPVATWEQLFIAVSPRAGKEVSMRVRRGTEEVSVTIVPKEESTFSMGDIGVMPDMHPQVRLVTPGDPADRAGLKPGDVITAVDGAPIRSNQADQSLVKIINASADKPLRFAVRRGTSELDVTVTPAKKGDVGLIGVQLSPFEVKVVEPGLIEAFGLSFQRNVEMAKNIFQTLAGLLTAETSPKQLMGPVGIAQLSGGAAKVGWAALFSLMAMISLNLGLLNLMPIPVLDGGHIFIMALEGLAGRDISIRIKERMLFAGFVALMALMVTVIYNDLTRIAWLERLMPWR